MTEEMLIRYIDSKYANSYLSGELYLSSLSYFWNLEKMRESPTNTQQDYGEGIALQIPHNKFNKFKELLPSDLSNGIIHDIRFRIQAYGYCNLSCFYRIDAICTNKPIPVDEDNLAHIANQNGFNLTGEQIRQMSPTDIPTLINKLIPKNLVISPKMNAFIQLPDKNMDAFGDMVIIVKDEREFINRIIAAVKIEGGECIIGNVQYHKMKDQVHPDKFGQRNHITFTLDGLLIDINSEFIDYDSHIIRYGCLDKYDRFKSQKEWRVCWLPNTKNFEGKILNVGKLDDIIELVPRESIRQRLLEMYFGHIPGFIDENIKYSTGTISYVQFKELIENIDKKSQIIFDFG